MDKPVLAPISDEGSNDGDIKMVLKDDNSSDNYNQVSDSGSNDNEEKEEENIFEKEIDSKLEETPKTTLNLKVMRAMKHL